MRPVSNLHLTSSAMRWQNSTDAKPGHYEVIRKVLGHKNLTTTYSHYSGAETQAALDLYDDVILEHRKGTSFGSTTAQGASFRNHPSWIPCKSMEAKNDCCATHRPAAPVTGPIWTRPLRPKPHRPANSLKPMGKRHIGPLPQNFRFKRAMANGSSFKT